MTHSGRVWRAFSSPSFAPLRSLCAKPSRFWHSFIPPPGATVLDLCCGPGRHALEFARRGFQVTGVDRTARYLETARTAARGAGLTIELVQEDMRSFHRPATLALALNLFSSFGYFAAASEDLTVLR